MKIITLTVLKHRSKIITNHQQPLHSTDREVWSRAWKLKLDFWNMIILNCQLAICLWREALSVSELWPLQVMTPTCVALTDKGNMVPPAEKQATAISGTTVFYSFPEPKLPQVALFLTRWLGGEQLAMLVERAPCLPWASVFSLTVAFPNTSQAWGNQRGDLHRPCPPPRTIVLYSHLLFSMH